MISSNAGESIEGSVVKKCWRNPSDVSGSVKQFRGYVESEAEKAC